MRQARWGESRWGQASSGPRRSRCRSSRAAARRDGPTAGAVGPPPGASSVPNPVTTGDSRRGVKLLNLPASTRSLSRVGFGLLSVPASRRDTAPGTTTFSFPRLARRGFAKAERPFGARKMTVFAERSDLKFLPVMVSVPPTPTRIGRTRVIEGFEAFLLSAVDAAGALASRAVADSASRQMVKRRRIALPPIDCPCRCLSCRSRRWTRSPGRRGSAGRSGAPERLPHWRSCPSSSRRSRLAPTFTRRISSTRSVYESPSSVVNSCSEPGPRYRKAQSAGFGLQRPSPAASSVESTRKTALPAARGDAQEDEQRRRGVREDVELLHPLDGPVPVVRPEGDVDDVGVLGDLGLTGVGRAAAGVGRAAAARVGDRAGPAVRGHVDAGGATGGDEVAEAAGADAEAGARSAARGRRRRLGPPPCGGPRRAPSSAVRTGCAGRTS